MKPEIRYIESAQNPLIKSVVQLLEKKKARAQQQLFVAEGLREIKLCVQGGYVIKQVFFVPGIISQEKVAESTGISTKHAEWICVSKQVFEKISYRSEIENAVVVVKYQNRHLVNIKNKQNQLFTVLSGVEKPGNIGAVIRSADATQSAILICDGNCDLYNPNVIRSSVGTVFTSEVFFANREEVFVFLRTNCKNIYTTFMNEQAKSIFEIKMDGNTAMILGTESSGLDDFWLNQGFQNAIIPMYGIVDSLNVSIAAAVSMFEWARRKEMSEK